MSADTTDLIVYAGAEKRFFIEMLTKDIELLPALLDLVDNSVDGARALHPDGILAGQWIEIDVGPEECTVDDNSGGIEIGLARTYAFRFGRPRDFVGVPRSVGQFGIGMKRALFKAGSHFRVESTFAPRSGQRGSKFILDVDVEAWAEQSEWQFVLEEGLEGYQLEATERSGTKITIDRLHRSVADDLRSPVVVDQLRNELRVRHQESLQAGLSVRLNGEVLTAARPALQMSEILKPINRRFTINTDDGDVDVRIVAGTIARRRSNSVGDDEVDEGRAENFQEPGDAGWYLFCNDRLLIAADRTFLTGWGDPAASYHPQYRLFRGFAYLEADDASLLPWNTTKTAVDRDSPVFRKVQSEMKTALVAVQGAINRAKSDRARFAEDGGNRTELERAFLEAPDVPLTELPASSRMVVPPSPPAPARTTRQNIQYSVDKETYSDVRDILGVSSAADVGRQTFEYFVEREV